MRDEVFEEDYNDDDDKGKMVTNVWRKAKGAF